MAKEIMKETDIKPRTQLMHKESCVVFDHIIPEKFEYPGLNFYTLRCNRYGFSCFKNLNELKKEFVIVQFDYVHGD